MMEPSEFKKQLNRTYWLILQHDKRISIWNKKISATTFKLIKKQGYIDPICHALFYNYNINAYSSLIVDLNVNTLHTKEDRKGNLQLLKGIPHFSPDSLISIKFIAEGTVNILDSDERMSFLLITSETGVTGSKEVFLLEKESRVNQDGSTSLEIRRIIPDAGLSASASIPLLNEFAHILRPNWTDPTDPNFN